MHKKIKDFKVQNEFKLANYIDLKAFRCLTSVSILGFSKTMQ